VLSAFVDRGASVRWAPPFIGLLLLLGLGGTALTTAVWYWLIQHDDVGRLSLYLFLVPIVGVGLAVVVLGEPVTLTTGVGMALTAFGVLMALHRDTGRSISRVAAETGSAACATCAACGAVARYRPRGWSSVGNSSRFGSFILRA
jgi:drug/metabolite transporter (DMT)-like permease